MNEQIVANVGRIAAKVVFALAVLLLAQGTAQAGAADEALPEGMSAAWWSQVQQSIVQARHSWAAESSQSGASFGESVATAGDVNGDGHDDVIVGAPEYVVQDGHGRAYVYHGSANGLSPTPNWTADVASQPLAGFGSAVSTAGDVNGDGFADIIVGAPDYDHGQDDEGVAVVFHGTGAGLRISPNWGAQDD